MEHPERDEFEDDTETPAILHGTDFSAFITVAIAAWRTEIPETLFGESASKLAIFGRFDEHRCISSSESGSMIAGRLVCALIASMLAKLRKGRKEEGVRRRGRLMEICVAAVDGTSREDTQASWHFFWLADDGFGRDSTLIKVPGAVSGDWNRVRNEQF